MAISLSYPDPASLSIEELIQNYTSDVSITLNRNLECIVLAIEEKEAHLSSLQAIMLALVLAGAAEKLREYIDILTYGEDE